MDHVLSTRSAPVAGRIRPLRRLLGAIALRRSRHQLIELDEHLLRDIGISRAEAYREAERPAWNAPHHWLR